MFTTVASYIDPIEAQIARGLLLAEGLEVHVGDEHLAVANWETPAAAWRPFCGDTEDAVCSAGRGSAHREDRSSPDASHSPTTLFGACESILISMLPFLTAINEYFVLRLGS